MAIPLKQQARREPIIANRIPPLRLAFGLNLLLGGLAFLPVVNANPTLMWSVLGTAGALLVFLFLLNRQVTRTGRRIYYEYLPKPVHYVQLDHAFLHLRLLGLVLARGLSLSPADRRATRLRLCARHAGVLVASRQMDPRLRPLSHRPQHQSVSVVQARLVLPAVPHAGHRRPRARSSSRGTATDAAPTSSILRPSRFSSSRSA